MIRTSFLTLLLLYIPSFIFAQESNQEIFLWPDGTPGFEHLKNEKPVAKDWWIKNIHNPSITVYRPEEGKANGAAVLICPGGGHRELVFNPEGKEPGEFFSEIGVTAFALKYRLGREENSPYDLNVHPVQDAVRALRYIRLNAKKWNIDPNRIGIMGFSAGGEVVNMTLYSDLKGNKKSSDPIEKTDANPNFQILIYPGPLGIPEAIPQNTPPAFLLAAIDDPCCSMPTLELLNKFKEANIPVEAHLYSKGGHGFNMGTRSDLVTLNTWPTRLADWLRDQFILDPDLEKKIKE